MKRIVGACGAALLLTLSSPSVVQACTCARVGSFEDNLASSALVVVGRVIATGMQPPAVDSPGEIVVRPSFLGSGLLLDVQSVPKGAVADLQATVWDLSYGECFNAVRELTAGTTVLAALSRVRDVPATVRGTWQAGQTIPASDYVVSGACGRPLRVLNAEEAERWLNRRIQ